MSQARFREWNFDGLVGPSHNYSGLSFGNLASSQNKARASNPKKAALQGLEKMEFLLKKGVPQAFIPPLERPYFPFLRDLGYRGSYEEQINKVCLNDPVLLSNIYSASSMWTANLASISPSPDTKDACLHISVANLSQHLHRSIEANASYELLCKLFNNVSDCIVHPPLPSSLFYSDEGAANHMRLCESHGSPGMEVFVYGHQAYQKKGIKPNKFPSRQSYEASFYTSMRNQVKDKHSFFLQQNPSAIDQGVFHNDVIAVANENVMLFHESAFVNQERALRNLRESTQKSLGFKPYFYEVKEKDLPLSTCVSSYLFNSQIITMDDDKMLLLCPSECKENPEVSCFIDKVIDQQGPIKEVVYLNLRESMQNGGGPACLRLRIVLSDSQEKSIHPGIVLDQDKLIALRKWVEKHYREELSYLDLQDTQLALECMDALDDLCNRLNLGNIYAFQNA